MNEENTVDRGCGARCRRTAWRELVAEFVGTFLLATVMRLPALAPVDSDVPLVTRAVTAGVTVCVIVQCFDHISGAQVNPAMSLAKAAVGRLEWRAAAAQAAAQVAGAALAAVLHPAPTAAPPVLGVTPALAVQVEALLTALLALANCAEWCGARSLHAGWPLRLAAVVSALSLAGGALTGASMNPALSFGVAISSNSYENLWVFVVGPLGGAALAAAVYRVLWLPLAVCSQTASTLTTSRQKVADDP